MGIKMEAARDSRGKDWTADTYKKGMGMEPLICLHCSTPVTHNPSYTRERDDKPVFVPAYFRLLPGKRHAEGCRHAVQEEIKSIARESTDLFESIKDGRYRLRLVMVKEALARIVNNPLSEGGQASNRMGRTVVKSPGKLLAYINSAKRVLQLRALCDEDEEIAEHLELVFEGSTVLWSQFYFETERHLEAFNAIRRNTVQHPIALNGTVKSKRLSVGKDKQKNVINLQKNKYQQNSEDSDNGIGVEVSIWSNNADWFSGISEGDEVVILGLWKVAAGVAEKPKTDGRFKTYTTNKLSVNLVLVAQIVKIPISSP